MKRVCLLAEDDPDLRTSVERMLKRVFSNAWGPSHEIRILSAAGVKEALSFLRELSHDDDTRLVLVTDYGLGDGFGSELIDACREHFAAARSIQVLQSGTLVSELLEDPVVRSLPEGRRLTKPVTLRVYEGLLPLFGACWKLSLEG